MSNWITNAISRFIGEDAVNAAANAITAGRFDRQIEAVIVETVRNGRDSGLSRTGFILKIAVELIDKSIPPMSYHHACKMAREVYAEFRRGNDMVKFGDPGWDWSGDGARTLAREYEIDLWENPDA